MFPKRKDYFLHQFMALAAIFFCSSFIGPALAGEAVVEAIRFGKDPDHSGTNKIRVVLDLTALVPVTPHLATNRREVNIDIVGVDWHPPANLLLRGFGPLIGYRFEAATGQIIIQANQAIRILGTGTLAPQGGTRLYRIIIDLAPDITTTLGTSPFTTSVAVKPTPAPLPTPVLPRDSASTKVTPASTSTLPSALPVPPVSMPVAEHEKPLDQGLRIALGQGGILDYAAAAEAFRMAAASGSPQGAFNLAELYRSGKGVPQDYQQAVQWLTKSANNGFAPAQFYLAVLIFNGVGANRDQKQAAELLEKAAAQGLPQARRALDDLHRAMAARAAPPP